MFHHHSNEMFCWETCYSNITHRPSLRLWRRDQYHTWLSRPEIFNVHFYIFTVQFRHFFLATFIIFFLGHLHHFFSWPPSPCFSQEISPTVSAFLASPETTVKQMLLNKCYNKVTITITFTSIVISIKSLSPPSIGSPSSWFPSLSWKRLETNRCWVLFWIRQSSSYSRCYL